MWLFLPFFLSLECFPVIDYWRSEQKSWRWEIIAQWKYVTSFFYDNFPDLGAFHEISGVSMELDKLLFPFI